MSLLKTAHNFVHFNKYQLQDITAINGGGKRLYVTPTGEKYPSVTTVLGANPEKKRSLMDWRRRVGNIEANRITKEATTQGTAMHLMCERYLLNQPDYKETDNEYAPDMFEAIRPILEEKITGVHALEAPLWSDHLRIAGRTDCVGEWEGRPAIIDFKTSMKPKKKEWIEDYFKQATAYAVMFRERTGLPVPLAVIVIAVRNGKPQLFVEKCRDWVDPLMDATDYYYKKVHKDE